MCALCSVHNDFCAACPIRWKPFEPTGLPVRHADRSWHHQRHRHTGCIADPLIQLQKPCTRSAGTETISDAVTAAQWRAGGTTRTSCPSRFPAPSPCTPRSATASCWTRQVCLSKTAFSLKDRLPCCYTTDRHMLLDSRLGKPCAAPSRHILALSAIFILTCPTCSAGAAAAGFDPSVWVSPPSLHVTVVMLKLYNGEARRLACEVMPRPTLCTPCFAAGSASRHGCAWSMLICGQCCLSLGHLPTIESVNMSQHTHIVVNRHLQGSRAALRLQANENFLPRRALSRSACKQVLQSVQDEVQAVRGDRPLCVRVRGLQLMKGDPAAAHVLSPASEMHRQIQLPLGAQRQTGTWRRAWLRCSACVPSSSAPSLMRACFRSMTSGTVHSPIEVSYTCPHPPLVCLPVTGLHYGGRLCRDVKLHLTLVNTRYHKPHRASSPTTSRTRTMTATAPDGKQSVVAVAHHSPPTQTAPDTPQDAAVTATVVQRVPANGGDNAAQSAPKEPVSNYTVSAAQ